MFGFLQMDGHLEQGAGQKGRLTVEINARDIDILRYFRHMEPVLPGSPEETQRTRTAPRPQVEEDRTSTRQFLPSRLPPRDHRRRRLSRPHQPGLSLHLTGHRKYGHRRLPVLLRQATHRRRTHPQAQRPRWHLQRPVHEGRRQGVGGTLLLRELPFPVPQTGSRDLAHRLGATGRHETRSLPAQMEGMGGPSAPTSRRRGVRGRAARSPPTKLQHATVAPSYRSRTDALERAVKKRARAGSSGPSAAQPFTQTNCFSLATTSTRSRCCSIT